MRTQRRTDELRRELEARYRKMLTDATRQRVEWRVKLETLREDLEDYQRERQSVLKMLAGLPDAREEAQQIWRRHSVNSARNTPRLNVLQTR